MKRFIILSVGVSIAGGAAAQSNVTMFGLVDAGVSYVSNEGGKSNLKFDDGIYTPNFLGFQGSEDLGGGTRAIFRLVNQFNLGNGTIIAGQGLFGQQAYVGLDSDRYGSIKLGSQYDFMTDALLFTGTDAAGNGGGFYNFRNGPFNALQLPNNPTGAFSWDRMNGLPIASAVKYVSPSIAGFSFGAMYGFGGVAGNFGKNSAYSLGLTYRNGAFSGGAAYTSQKYPGPVDGNPQTRVSNWGVGAHYSFGIFGVNALVTTVRNSVQGGAIYMGQLGGTWDPAPDLQLLLSYMYMKGNANLDNNHANQVNATATYSLSKRTAVYVSAAYQRANSGAQAQINGVLDPDGASSSPSQAIARIGIKTSF